MSCTETRALPQAFQPPARTRRGLLHWFRTMAAIRKQRRDLSHLDAHLRRDIGLSESDVQKEIQRQPWDIPSWWR